MYFLYVTAFDWSLLSSDHSAKLYLCHNVSYYCHDLLSSLLFIVLTIGIVTVISRCHNNNCCYDLSPLSINMIIIGLTINVSRCHNNNYCYDHCHLYYFDYYWYCICY